MRKRFTGLEVSRAFGVAPSTGSIIASLLNGEVHPERAAALEPWPFADFDIPPPVREVMCAICKLLYLGPESIWRSSSTDGKHEIYLLDIGDHTQPTIMWSTFFGGYKICPADQLPEEMK